MKKTVLLSLLSVIMLGLSAQTTPASSIEVAPCTGQNTKPLDFGEKSIMFNQSGINLVKYDWSNPNLNCHINNTITYSKSNKTMKTIAYYGCLPVGISMIIIGAFMESSQKTTYYGATTGSSGKPLIVLGGLSLGSTIALGIGGSNAKKKRDYHLGQVIDYYQKKGW